MERLVFAIVDDFSQWFSIEGENSHCVPFAISGLTHLFGGSIQNDPTLLSISADAWSSWVAATKTPLQTIARMVARVWKVMKKNPDGGEKLVTGQQFQTLRA